LPRSGRIIRLIQSQSQRGTASGKTAERYIEGFAFSLFRIQEFGKHASGGFGYIYSHGMFSSRSIQ
jgi:hypothetical protein